MKLALLIMTLALAASPRLRADATAGHLAVLPDPAPQSLFSGDARVIHITFHNPDSQPAEVNLRTRLSQATSATAAPLGATQDWKKLQVLPGQTVLETATLSLPAVTAETRFIVEWLDEQDHVLGRSDLLVYPDNLLAQLKPLTGEEPLGVFDPQNQLKPLLKHSKVKFTDLAEDGLENFTGKLIILGPFQTKSQLRESFVRRIPETTRKGIAIVWLQPPPAPREKPTPSFYLVPEGTGTVMVVQAALVSDLPGHPQSQLNLIYFCQLALHPEPFPLPHSTNQP